MNNDTQIYKIVSDSINDFTTNKVVVVDKCEFNQRYTLEQIIRLYNSKFKEGDTDREGFRKYFKNIVRNPCNAATKATKFTLSDIQVVPAPGQSSRYTWLMDRDLKYYLKEKEFSKILNRLFIELPIFGSVVLKKVKDNFHFVDLRNLINEQASDSLKDAQYVIEQHNYSVHEFRKKPWDNIDEAITMWRASKQPYLRVLEYYGEVPESEFGGSEDKYTYARFIVYIPEVDLGDRLDVNRSGVILAKDKISIDEFPYRELHWEKIPGRWLGVGRVELLTDPQVRTNEIINLRVKSSYVAGLNIWQTRDSNFKQNLIRDVGQGQVVFPQDRLERVPTEDRNTYSFTEEEQGWKGNRDEITFTYDVVRGERPPAGTPLGSSQMAAQMITSYFEHIREGVSTVIKDLIYHDIIPAFKKSPEHYLKLVGDDLETWQNYRIDLAWNKELLQFVKKHNSIPTSVQGEAMKAVITDKIKRTEQDAWIPKDLYKDVKYLVDIVITGQDRDTRVEAANMATILQTIVADPTVLTDPAKRKIFGKQLELVGLNINDISAVSQDAQEIIGQKVGEQKGGGISRPSLPQNLSMGGGGAM